jgi:aryl-alcohol dehydrogenase-like predicted oxidoreductase
MRYQQLGRTGLFVSELCLGTMTFGGKGFWTRMGALEQESSQALVKRALDSGINFIDTADVYSEGESEIILGAALKNLGVARNDVVIATKCFGSTGAGPNDRGASRYHIMQAVEASLKRLQLDHIDLYQIHGFDTVTPVEEILSALDNLVSRGLVRYVGCSNWAAWQIMKGLGISNHLGLQRFETLQAYYTIAGRDLEREIVPLLNDQKLGLLVWSPLAGGFLADKSKEGTRRGSFEFPPVDADRGEQVLVALREVARARETSTARVALAWLLAKPHVTSVIIGARNEAQLLDNIAAVKLKLEPAEVAALDAASTLPPEYPGWMFERQGAGRVPAPFEADPKEE